jgi:hypothetical protein
MERKTAALFGRRAVLVLAEASRYTAITFYKGWLSFVGERASKRGFSMPHLSLPTINWRRGTFRFWIVLSVLWCVAVVVAALNRMDVARPFVSAPKVHVKISDTETWDYPPEWGVGRIEADLTRRLADLDRKDREWAG